MRALAAAFSLFALTPVLGSSAQAQSRAPAPQPPPPAAIEPPRPLPPQPPVQEYPADVPAVDAADDPELSSPYPPTQAPLVSPEEYAADIDNDVAYDDTVAQRYDDGYDPEAYASFDQALSPYGTWVDDDAYGRVWVPATSVVGNDFSPYATGGHWAQTEYGWTWVSDWDWGWAPFHYGRWAVMGGGRWGWVPGTIWGPSWVAWRSGNGYVGWAPLPPRRVTIGSPLGRGSPWRFMRASDLGYPNRPCLPARMVPSIFGRMTVVSNPRTLTNAGMNVRVNVGPTLVGRPTPAGSPSLFGRPPTGGKPSTGPTLIGRPPAMAPGPAPARLAAVAPQMLPRYAIAPRVGYPIAARPWIQAGIVRPVPRFGSSGTSGPSTAYGPARGLAWNAPEQRGGGYGRMSVPGPYGQPAYRPASGFGSSSLHAGSTPFRGAAAFPSRGAAAPAFRGAPASGFRGAPPPAFRGSAPSPVFHGAPAGSSGPRFSAPAFSHPSGGFHPGGVGGGGGRSFGGGGRRR